MSELIDCHAHCYLTTLPLAKTAWHRPSKSASHQQLAQTLAENGVDGMVLAAASILADENAYALEAVASHRNWRTTVIAPPDTPFPRLRAWKDAGAVGIRLQCMHHALPDFASPEYRQFFKNVAALGWHVHVHDAGDRLAEILPILTEAGVPIMVDHFGRPDPDTGREGKGYQAMLRSAETGRLWAKLSAGFRLHSAAFAKQMATALLSDLGPDRLVWGSDWPFANYESQVSYQDVRATFESWVPEAMRNQVGSATPRAFYFD